MRKLIYLFAIFAPFLLGYKAYAQNTNSALAFYLVSEEKIEGGRFVDTPEFPKIGYIAAKPDLVVTSLRDVYPQESENVMVDKDGKHTVVAGPPTLTVRLRAEDGKQFAALTQRSIGKRLLVVLGEKPTAAPMVRMPIQGGSFLIEFSNLEDLKTTEDALRKLIR
jgi:hypothetical protein